MIDDQLDWDYHKLLYARELRDNLLNKFKLRFSEDKDILVALKDFLGLTHKVLPTRTENWTGYLLIEVPATDELIQKLEALTGPHGHTYYKALVARGILPPLKNSPVV